MDCRSGELAKCRCGTYLRSLDDFTHNVTNIDLYVGKGSPLSVVSGPTTIAVTYDYADQPTVSFPITLVYVHHLGLFGYLHSYDVMKEG